ncbi:MAG: propanediol dehydratase, partial [Deltaproteobacteria bacterium]|nr:propanediol dehydratase [Deltaproteobacteria bacterium]
MPRSKRFELLAQRPVNKDSCIHEWPEKGLVNMESAFDPKPSLKITNGVVKGMDGKKRKDFDIIDHFIIEHALDLRHAPKAMAMDSLKIARMIVDIHVPRHKIIETISGLTPA